MEFVTIRQDPRYEISPSGVIRNAKTKRIKSQYLNEVGYRMVSISRNNKSNSHRVHRLIAYAFIPNPDNLPEVNHLNGIKTDNRIENLEWATHSENMRHAFATGLANNAGERNGQNKLSPEQVEKIRQMLEAGISQYKIAAIIGGISRSTVLKIKLNQMWKRGSNSLRAS